MSQVAVLECRSYTGCEEAVRSCLDLISADRLLKPGARVLIKPNVLMAAAPEKGITTRPEIVDAICSYLSDHDVKVFIGDSSGMGSEKITQDALEKSGMAAVAQKWGAEIINFDSGAKAIIKIPDGALAKSIAVSTKLVEMDFVIDACKLKTHALTGLTGAVKNMFGILPGGMKTKAHADAPSPKQFSEFLLDVYLARKPDICIMDAVVSMEGNGPSSGKLRQTGLVLASLDGIALDRMTARIAGFSEAELPVLCAAKRRGLTGEIETIGASIDKLNFRFAKPMSYKVPGLSLLSPVYGFLMRDRLVIDKRRCVKCGDCRRACPRKAIRIQKGEFPEFDREYCMMCFCCQEMCPQHAIEIRRSFVTRIAERRR